MRPSVLTARATTRPTDLTASARRSLGSRSLLPNAHSAPLSYGCLLSVAEVSGASHLCMRGCHGYVRSFDHRMKVRTMTSWVHRSVRGSNLCPLTVWLPLGST